MPFQMRAGGNLLPIPVFFLTMEFIQAIFYGAVLASGNDPLYAHLAGMVITGLMILLAGSVSLYCVRGNDYGTAAGLALIGIFPLISNLLVSVVLLTEHTDLPLNARMGIFLTALVTTFVTTAIAGMAHKADEESGGNKARPIPLPFTFFFLSSAMPAFLNVTFFGFRSDWYWFPAAVGLQIILACTLGFELKEEVKEKWRDAKPDPNGAI